MTAQTALRSGIYGGLVVGIIMALSACTTSSTPEESSLPADPVPVTTTWITRAGSWPHAAEHRTELATFVDSHNQATHLIRFDVQVSADRLTLIGQSTLGVPLYESSLSNGRLGRFPRCSI